MPQATAVKSAIKNLPNASGGWCPICGGPTVFLVTNLDNPRWGLQCARCRSVPRNRMTALALSETLGVRSLRVARQHGLTKDVYIAAAAGYLIKALPVGTRRLTTSEFMPGVAPGDPLPDGVSTCQDLHQLTYPDDSFDVMVSEDVLEHVRRPGQCFDEIHRVLHPGGRHIFTVPYNHDQPTITRVDTSSDEDVHLMEEEWHGDSLRHRVLAYRNFGFDIFEQLADHGFATRLVLPTYTGRRAGVLGAEVFVATKV